MAVDQAGHGDAARGLDHQRALGRGDGGGDGADRAVLHQDVAARQVAEARVHRQHQGAADQDRAGRRRGLGEGRARRRQGGGEHAQRGGGQQTRGGRGRIRSWRASLPIVPSCTPSPCKRLQGQAPAMDAAPPNAYVRRTMLQAVRILAALLILAIGGLWAAAWLGRAEGEGVAESFSRIAAPRDGAGDGGAVRRRGAAAAGDDARRAVPADRPDRPRRDRGRLSPAASC